MPKIQQRKDAEQDEPQTARLGLREQQRRRLSTDLKHFKKLRNYKEWPGNMCKYDWTFSMMPEVLKMYHAVGGEDGISDDNAKLYKVYDFNFYIF